MFRRLAVLFAVALLAVCPAGAPASADFCIRTGPHFRVLCHFDDGAAAAAALETVEAVWPLASGLFGIADEPIEPPLDVHLYRRAADYLAEERALARGKFDRNLAFSSWDTGAAHVALQPDLTDEALAAVGLTAQTRHNLAHEAAHLVCWRASPGYRSHPDWFSEGSAIWIEQETLAARGWSLGCDEDPYVATDAVVAARLLAGGHLPSATTILRGGVKDMELHERYAVQSLLFRRLVTRRDAPAFRAALARALRLDEGPEYAKAFLDTVTEPYATEGFEGLDLDFEQFVRSRTPAWDEICRSLATAGAAWPQIAFAEQSAMAWRTAPVGDEAYELRGEIEILPGSGKTNQMNLLLSREKGVGYFSIAFVAGHGVDVFRYHLKEARWEKLASAPTKAVQLWRRLPFRVAVDGAKVAIRLDGAELLTLEVKDHPLTGAWGLGAQPGSAGVWRNVRVEGAKPGK